MQKVTERSSPEDLSGNGIFKKLEFHYIFVSFKMHLNFSFRYYVISIVYSPKNSETYKKLGNSVTAKLDGLFELSHLTYTVKSDLQTASYSL